MDPPAAGGQFLAITSGVLVEEAWDHAKNDCSAPESKFAEQQKSFRGFLSPLHDNICSQGTSLMVAMGNAKY